MDGPKTYMSLIMQHKRHGYCSHTLHSSTKALFQVPHSDTHKRTCERGAPSEIDMDRLDSRCISKLTIICERTDRAVAPPEQQQWRP